MSQSEKSFTVSDRRHFTPEGRPREDPAEAEEPQKHSAPHGEATPASGADEPVEFAQFILGLASEAGRLMAGDGAPAGTSPAEALAGARHIVAILEMLKDKTETRRTPEEDALLSELLFQLRMAYVEQTRAGKP
jgi:hypothetical protein